MGCDMQVSIGSLLDGAKQATGAVAIIDVFRAFTTAAVAFANGTSGIIMVSSVDEALSLRDSGLVQVCMGEVRGRAPPGFDFGNSPFEISDIDFRGKATPPADRCRHTGHLCCTMCGLSLCSIAGDCQSDREVTPIAWHRTGFAGVNGKQRNDGNRRG
jgi:hypothetical protein